MSLLKSLAKQVTDAFSSATQDIAALRERIASQAAELRDAIQNPRPPAEVVEAFNLWVDGMAEHQAREHGRSMVTSYFGAAPGRSDVPNPWGIESPMTWGVACLMFPEALKAGFAELVAQTEYPAGPATVDRATVIRRLSAALEGLEAEEAAIVDEINAVQVQGVRLEFAHRPELAARREEAVRRAEAAERAEAERIATERRVAEWRAAGLRTLPNATIVRVPVP